MIKPNLFFIKITGLFFFVLLQFSIVAQRTSFRFYEYNRENKLKEELVKSAKQDSLGIYYFATDQGLLCLRNDQFSKLILPNGKSEFFKEIFKCRSGRLLAVSDDAIYKIESSISNETLKLYLDCNLDSTLPKYPKHLFEDKNNHLWISDYNHLFKYDDHTITKYQMDVQNVSSSYARSFQFLECDNGNLIVVSQQGWFHRYNKRTDAFEKLEFQPGFLVHSSLKIGSNEFLLGTSEGIFKITFDRQGNFLQQDTVSREIIASCFEKLSETRILVGTWFQGLIEIGLNNEYQFYPVGGFPYITINDIYRDDFGKFWVSTNSGIVVMEKKFFSSQFLSGNSEYISCLSANRNGDVYFSARNQILKIDSNKQFQLQAYSFEGSLSVFRVMDDFVFIGTEQGKLYVFKDGILISDLKISNHVISGIEVISNQEVWVVSQKELFKVNFRLGKIKSLLDEFDHEKIVQDIYLLPNKNLYIAGESKDSYLFLYNWEKNEIENLSRPFPFEISGDFWIRDIEVDRDTLYLGSNQGLLKFYDSTIERVDLEEITIGEVNSVALDKSKTIWLTSSNGVIRKRKSDISLFSTEHGLPSKTFTLRNLLFDKNDFVWVGTSNGLAVASIKDDTPKTPIPTVHMAKNEGKSILPGSNVSMSTNSMLLMDVTAPIYPQKQNHFKYCIVKTTEKDFVWTELTSKNQILISDLTPGKYNLLVKCKHDGNFQWSESRSIPIVVHQVWYLRWYILFADLLLVFVLVLLTNAYTKKRAERNLIALEELVSKRTKQLQEANKNLQTANVAKDKFLSIIAHDLRNPFNAIRSFSRILLEDSNNLSEEEQKDLIETIYRSSNNTYQLLESLLEWANVQKGNFKLNQEVFDLEQILTQNLELHKNIAALKGIVLQGYFKSLQVKADRAMIDTVIRNLLSNAIKFSHKGQVIELHASHEIDFVVVKVVDYGVGMTKRQLDQLFKIDSMFTREGTASETGTGFGLMLCKEFVELNGGRIWAESENGKGATFFFTIPIHQSKL